MSQTDRSASSDRRRPKNYLAPRERQRLFWLFMPPAIVVIMLLGWVEQAWFRKPAVAPAPQVDTVVRDPLADGAVPDAVLIEPEPEPFVGQAEQLGATVAALARVRDDTVFRSDDHDAWFQIWMTLRSSTLDDYRRADARRVSFSELHGQPRSFRGRLVRLRGTLHRLERVSAPPNEFNIEGYWQGWLEPEGGPASPIVVYFLALPAGMPEGLRIDERVEVIGYFFKRWVYPAKDAVRTAPLVMALEPIWKPRPDIKPAVDSIGMVALGTMAAVVLLTVLGIRAAAKGPRRPAAPSPADLEKSLADVELFSAEESLRRMSAAARQEDPPAHDTTGQMTSHDPSHDTRS